MPDFMSVALRRKHTNDSWVQRTPTLVAVNGRWISFEGIPERSLKRKAVRGTNLSKTYDHGCVIGVELQKFVAGIGVFPCLQRHLTFINAD